MNQVLIGLDIKQHIRLVASGKTSSGFNILSKVALGADTVNAARTMMLALGCIQSQSCNTNKCPTGITTQDPKRGKAVHVESKHIQVANFHEQTVASFMQLCGAIGYEHPDMLCPSDIYRRFDQGLLHFDEIYTPLAAGQLLSDDIPETYLADWQKASVECF